MEETQGETPSLSREESKKLDIALYYTGGDMDKSLRMLSGSYRDLTVIKGQFTTTLLYGAFILFFNHDLLRLLDSFVVITSLKDRRDVNITDDWKAFEQAMMEDLASREKDITLIEGLKGMLAKSFDYSFSAEMQKILSARDDISATRLLLRIIQDYLGKQKVHINVNSQHDSSLEMELHSLGAKKIDPAALVPAQERTDSPAGLTPEEDAEPRAGRDGVKLIIKGKLILSPIRGKAITGLSPGDRVMFNIVDSNPRAVRLAEGFKAYNDGKFSPMPATITNIKHTSRGYRIYAIVAVDILAFITEEERNIKIEMDPGYRWSGQKVEKSWEWPVLMKFMLAAIFILMLVWAAMRFFK